MQECKASSVPVGGGMEGEEWYEQRNEDASCIVDIPTKVKKIERRKDVVYSVFNVLPYASRANNYSLLISKLI